MNSNEDKLIDQTRRALNARADQLDDHVIARLRTARMRATEVADRKHGRLSWLNPLGDSMTETLARPVGALVTATLVLAVATSLWIANPSVPRHGIEDMEILASAESPEFYQDLEFYLWLEEHPRAG